MFAPLAVSYSQGCPNQDDAEKHAHGVAACQVLLLLLHACRQGFDKGGHTRQGRHGAAGYHLNRGTLLVLHEASAAQALGHHLFRVAVARIFVGDDPYLESDTVFGVKETLVAPFERLSDAPTLWRSPFDFVLTPA